MNEISGVDLKAKLDRGDDFKLVMVVSQAAFRLKHIRGSVNIFLPLIKAERICLALTTRSSCTAPAGPASPARSRTAS